MYIYLLLFLAFIVQEPVTSGAIILEAYQQHYNVWVIHLIFLVATIIDIIGGYYLGKYIHERFADNKVVRYCKKKAEALAFYAGRYGQKAMLVIFGQTLFPISALLTPWLGISMIDSFIYLLLGEIIFWYIGVWLLVLGVSSTIAGTGEALYAVIAILLVVSIVMQYLKKRNVPPEIAAGLDITSVPINPLKDQGEDQKKDQSATSNVNDTERSEPKV